MSWRRTGLQYLPPWKFLSEQAVCSLYEAANPSYEAVQTVTGDARTVGQRDAELRKRFGKMAEQARKDIEAKRAQQQAQR